MDNLLLYIAIFVISYILITHINHKFQNLPPSPFPKLPILGHLHLLTNPNTIHRTFSKISEKYGPVMYLALGSSRPTIVVSSPSAVEECLSTNDITFANRPHFLIGQLTGFDKSMAGAPYGPVWKAHRRVTSTELVSNQQLNLLSYIREEEVKFMIRRIYDDAVENVSVDIGKLFKELTTNVMTRLIAGKSIYGKNGDPQEVKRYNEFKKIVDDGAFCVVDFLPFLKYFGVEKLLEKKYMARVSLLDGIFQDMIDAQLRIKEEQYEDEDESSSAINKNRRNFIQILLDLEKTDAAFSRHDNIKSLTQGLLFAGSDSTSSTLEWALALLLNNPRVLKRAKQEIDAHVGSAVRLLTDDDLPHLHYLNCILKETMRMYPVGPLLIPHLSSTECRVGGYHIPRGTMLMVNAWSIHHDPMVWEDPFEFKPERFECINNDAIRYQFLPFSTGRRGCPGENLAMRFMGLTLGSLLHCFAVEKAGDIDMMEKFGAAMAKANPLLAKFKPHKDMLHLMPQ